MAMWVKLTGTQGPLLVNLDQVDMVVHRTGPVPIVQFLTSSGRTVNVQVDIDALALLLDARDLTT